jgi:hypothetical protein
VRKVKCPSCNAELVLENGGSVNCSYCSRTVTEFDLVKEDEVIEATVVNSALDKDKKELINEQPEAEIVETNDHEKNDNPTSIFIDQEQSELYYLIIELLEKNDVKTARSKIKIFEEDYRDSFLHYSLVIKYELRYLKNIAENIVLKLTDNQKKALNLELIALFLEERKDGSEYYTYLTILNSSIVKFIDLVESAVESLKSYAEKELLLEDINELFISVMLFDLKKENSKKLLDVYKKLIIAKFGLFPNNGIKKLAKTKLDSLKDLVRNVIEKEIFNQIYGIIS